MQIKIVKLSYCVQLGQLTFCVTPIGCAEKGIAFFIAMFYLLLRFVWLTALHSGPLLYRWKRVFSFKKIIPLILSNIFWWICDNGCWTCTLFCRGSENLCTPYPVPQYLQNHVPRTLETKYPVLSKPSTQYLRSHALPWEIWNNSQQCLKFKVKSLSFQCNTTW